ncbi:putative transposase, IS605 OrfB family [Candidatus Nitrososphaera gargensis Ga9.2]|uniref:Putative transposase, IS605 OrfB family n=1 Tax=Nitrososphaera gargensis (strain Ga9.2) TaxID=1237085 RepID=K0ILE2_NITGG|nr:putative transposase, IS605 OrfB family [Candidatus Nitrososphaera gargensis Ga9.2]
MHRIPVGILKGCTIIRDVDQWYACITTTTDDSVVEKSIKTDVTKSVGIDVGLINWLALSDGRIIENPLDFDAQAKKIKQLQKNHARKQKGSRNREKARIQLAKAWRQVRRCRDDFVHKTSRTIADQGYTFVIFEKVEYQKHGQEPPSSIGNNGCHLGKAAPINCLQGRKARWTGTSRQSRWYIAEMLWVWSGSKRKA